MPLNSPALLLLPRRLSLIAQTVTSLRAALTAGRWRGQLPGERDLCRQLEVSRPTLRSALLELERDGTLAGTPRSRRKIRLRATSPSPRAPVLAVLSPCPLRALSPNTILMIDALKDRLALSGWSLQFHVSRAGFSRKPGQALASLTSRLPAGIWLLVGSFRPTGEWFLREAIPCLVCGTCPDDLALASVDADHFATCRHAAGELHRRGVRRVVLVRREEAAGGDDESERGFRNGWEATSGTPLRVLRHHGRDHLIDLLDEFLRSSLPPDSFFVLRAAHALTVTMHLLRRGRRLPEDVAVVSRDDEPYLEHTSPLITRYGIDPEHFARQVSRLVQRLAEADPGAIRKVRLMPTLRRGETL